MRDCAKNKNGDTPLNKQGKHSLPLRNSSVTGMDLSLNGQSFSEYLNSTHRHFGTQIFAAHLNTYR